jgi:O-antigen/teichoic acid export membrane protein
MKNFHYLVKIKKVKNLFNVKLVKDASFTIRSHFTEGISGLLINTVIGNHLGVGNLGIINQGLSIYMILALLSNFRIQTSAQKHTSQHSDNDGLIKGIFSNAIVARSLSSCVVVFSFFY